MITYTDKVEYINPEMLTGFFIGWDKHPSPEQLYRILVNSEHIVLAYDEKSSKVVGFINALSDGVLSAYIPLLEVLPEYQHRGIGGELIRRIIAKLKDHYMIDLVCDESLERFYSDFGLIKYTAMMKRNYDKQTGMD